LIIKLLIQEFAQLMIIIFTHDPPTRFDFYKVIIWEVYTKVYKNSKFGQRYECIVK